MIEIVNKNSNAIMALCSIVTVFVTAFMAILTWWNYKFIKLIEEENEKFKNQTLDLYQAIVISNLVTSVEIQTRMKLDIFKKFYNGKSAIFKE